MSRPHEVCFFSSGALPLGAWDAGPSSLSRGLALEPGSSIPRLSELAGLWSGAFRSAAAPDVSPAQDDSLVALRINISNESEHRMTAVTFTISLPKTKRQIMLTSGDEKGILGNSTN
uniref:Uncharacterized protein n=1 Tax=Knipowitschia caucasica TaxID=637954 RepID=A0AAV2L4N2_KNICA